MACAVRTSSAGDFVKALEHALAHPGASSHRAVVPESLSGAKRKLLPWLLRSLPHRHRRWRARLKKKIAP